MIIAIDGPAGSGKSTIAKEIARRMNLTYIDTGAMYRAVTLKVIRSETDMKDDVAIRRMLEDTSIDFVEGKIYLDGDYVEEWIRTPQVTKMVSAVSAMSAVREAMVEKQREIAKRKSSVLDGRDIGTVVFPKADVKIFLVADVSVRARRRMQENQLKGIKEDIKEVERSIRQRDIADSTRRISPLKKAADAIEIDSSHQSIEEVTQSIIEIIEGGRCQ